VGVVSTGHDSEAVGRRTARLDLLAEDASSVLAAARSASSTAGRWDGSGDGAAAVLPPAAVALLEAVAAVTDAAAAALAARAEELRDQARRAREIDQDTADRLRALRGPRPDLHLAPDVQPGGSDGGGDRRG
jgi:hypothetical protein